MTLLLFLFLGAATILWLSIFGYILALCSITFRKRWTVRDLSTLPEIAIVIPTLNEEELILKKLKDLWRADYPRDLITIVVVDGGSVDRTTEVVRRKISRGETIQLLCVNGSQGRTDQIIHALGYLRQEIVVVTDADSVLDPSCIRELVSVLEQDPQTAIIGATVRPGSALLEERIHWWFLNYLWWLEGEALSSAGVSGVCYACRREVVLAASLDAQADSLRLPFATSAGGYGVRICRTAYATEVRVPQSPSEMMRFRRRRGASYLSELRSSKNSHAPTGWRLARLMRLWHFLIMPKVGAGLAVLACVLLWTPHWQWTFLVFAAFAVPAYGVMLSSSTLAIEGHQWWKLTIAASRLLAITLASMLTLNYRPSAHRQREVRP